MHNLKVEKRERAFLVGLIRRQVERWETEEHLTELALLADTAGADVCQTFIQERAKIDPTYFIGRGKAEDIAQQAKEDEIDLLIFDDDLSPAQVRNLENLSQKKILDRSGLILDIFAHRARTREAKTQVELAQLNYLLPRLTRQWTHLSRQVGGIGTRGPGETQLEVDRRMIRSRISRLKKELGKITKQRDIRRRGRVLNLKIALVGYTNAGKSTLMNALTQSNVFVEDRLFATLDATIRRMKLPNQSEALLIDTVGFIRKLPHHLVASFMSTLEEAREADILLHVADITHQQMSEQMAVVKDVLGQLHILHKPTLYVFNKVDRLEHTGIINQLRTRYEPSVFVSATKGLFLTDLSEAVLDLSQIAVREMDLMLDQSHGDVVSKIHDLAEIVDTKYDGQQMTLKIRATAENASLISVLLEKAGVESPVIEQKNNEHV